MRKGLRLVLMTVWIMALLSGCGGGKQNAAPSTSQDTFPSTKLEGPQAGPGAVQKTNEKEQTVMKMNVQIGNQIFTATLEDNQAVEELVEMMKAGGVVLTLDDYGGFEKVGSLGKNLTTSNSQTTTAAGDIVLYNGSNIVMFYGSNSWSYTRLGKIDDLTDWENALGSGSVTVILTLID